MCPLCCSSFNRVWFFIFMSRLAKKDRKKLLWLAAHTFQCRPMSNFPLLLLSTTVTTKKKKKEKNKNKNKKINKKQQRQKKKKKTIIIKTKKGFF